MWKTAIASLDNTRLLFIALFLTLACAQSLVDPDYYWHLKTGEYLVSARALPAGDVFSSTRAGQPWVLHEWLFEVVLCGAFAWLGSLGVRLLTVALATVAFGIVFVLARRIAGSGGAAAAFAFTAITPYAIGIMPRPQLVTYACFAIFLFALLSFKYCAAHRPLYLLPPVMVVWVNAHGGYVLGIGLLGLFLACEWIGYWTGPARDPAQRQRLLLLAKLAAVTVLASLANPGCLERWLYPFQVLGMAANEQIAEWQSPNFHQLGPKAYLALVLAFLLSYAYAARKPDLTEIAIPVFFLVNGCMAQRHIPLAALVLLPFGALALARCGLGPLITGWRAKLKGNSKELGDTAYALNWVLLGAIVMCAGVFGPLLQERQQQRLERILPVHAAEFVAAQQITGKMFNSYNDGGYLIHRLGPGWKVMIDGRADVYGDRFFADYLDIYSGAARWKEKFDALAIDFAILPLDAPIRQLLLADARFREVYLDQHHAVLVRDVPAYAYLPGKKVGREPAPAQAKEG